ncbi:hypothetical protein TRFO_00903 [Tritrichomonas foetus]|uniref:Uncharacterized protein n=1 Tax=Tritrichomonas foetus TaxID=1144522 RepID=A0A1J4L3H9_9EUKA|nr:hypothetical protein TRFO_00903 [Tritrichomonas foetus]|eukprot:OHT17632.1 hypothetical protein TRFO_00903 [Tritrichomonas foetus]
MENISQPKSFILKEIYASLILRLDEKSAITATHEFLHLSQNSQNKSNLQLIGEHYNFFIKLACWSCLEDLCEYARDFKKILQTTFSDDCVFDESFYLKLQEIKKMQNETINNLQETQNQIEQYEERLAIEGHAFSMLKEKMTSLEKEKNVVRFINETHRDKVKKIHNSQASLQNMMSDLIYSIDFFNRKISNPKQAF